MYRKIISILILVPATLVVISKGLLPLFLGTIDVKHDLLLTFEAVVNGFIGIFAAIYLLKSNNKGLILAKIWSILQIPIIIYGVNGIVTFAINFEQIIKLTIMFGSFGINFFGFVMLSLISRVKLDK